MDSNIFFAASLPYTAFMVTAKMSGQAPMGPSRGS